MYVINNVSLSSPSALTGFNNIPNFKCHGRPSEKPILRHIFRLLKLNFFKAFLSAFEKKFSSRVIFFARPFDTFFLYYKHVMLERVQTAPRTRQMKCQIDTGASRSAMFRHFPLLSYILWYVRPSNLWHEPKLLQTGQKRWHQDTVWRARENVGMEWNLELKEPLKTGELFYQTWNEMAMPPNLSSYVRN